MPAKGEKHKLQALGSSGTISKGTKFGQSKTKALKQLRELVVPSEVWRSMEAGLVPESLRAEAADAVEEAAQIAEDLGGVDRIGKTRGALVQRFARLGTPERALSKLVVQAGSKKVDLEAVRALTSLVREQRGILKDLGLERRNEDDDDRRLFSYVARRDAELAQGRTHGANGSAPDAEVVDASEGAEGANE